MDTSEKILAAALEVFVENGLSAPTLSVAQKAKVSNGSLFHYFPTKNSLILTLYRDILMELYQATIPLFSQFVVDEPGKYREISKQSWYSNINWGLDNWQKFEYLQIFESSLLADQFSVKGDIEIEALLKIFQDFGEKGIQYGYTSPRPIALTIEISRALINTLTKFIHANPDLRYNEDFMKQAEQDHWNISSGYQG